MRLSIRIAILLGVSGLYFMSFFHRVAVPGTVSDDVQADFNLSASGVAALGSIYLFVYSGLQPLAGLLADAWGPGRTLLLSGLLLSIGGLLFPQAESVTTLYLTRGLVGVGAAFIYVSMLKEFDELFGERSFPIALGVGIVLGYAGGLFGTLPFERLMAHQGWRQALQMVALGGTAAWVLAMLFMAGAGRLKRRRCERFGGWVGHVLRNRDYLALTASCSVTYAIGFLLQATIGKKFLQDVCGISSDQAAGFTFAMMLACMTSVFLSSLVAQRTRRRRPFVILAAVMILAASLMLLIGAQFVLSRGYFLGCYILLGAAYSFTVFYATAAKELNPREAAGTAIGLMNAGVYLMVALLTAVSGVVLDAYAEGVTQIGGQRVYPPEAYRAVFALCALMALVSCGCAWSVREGRPSALRA
ncbi:MAG: MFS transporter [Lentisphaerae bacterium]|nr:MFS transporter [Lentisphaerota bacterium]